MMSMRQIWGWAWLVWGVELAAKERILMIIVYLSLAQLQAG